MRTEAGVGLDPIQQSMLAYWRAARAGMPVPTVDALDPLKFGTQALPYLIVADVLDDRGLVQYRLVGEEMVRRWGASFRGKRSDELFSGDYRKFIERGFAMARAEGRPVYSESIFRWNDGGWIKTTRLLLPFADAPDSAPSRVLVVQIFLGTDDHQVVPEIRVLRQDDAAGRVLARLGDERVGRPEPGGGVAATADPQPR